MILKNIVDSGEALKNLFQLDLDIDIAYKLAKNIKNVQEHLTVYEKTKMKLFEKHGEKDGENPGQLKVNNKNLPEFNNEYEKLINQEIDLEVSKITIEDLKDSEGKNRLKPSDIFPLLTWLLVEKEKDK